MEYTYENGNIILNDVKDFSPEQTLSCGQCFRFKEADDGGYILTAKNRTLYISEKDNSVILHRLSSDEFNEVWNTYFDFETDYSAIKKALTKDDEIMKKSCEYAPGIRILNQDFFECLISFIISQNNRIPMIKKVIENICEKYGETIEGGYAFPSPEALAAADINGLMSCKTGFRAKYILDAAEKVCTGEISEDKIKKADTDEARDMLMKIKGVGPKVADCVLLFSCGKRSAFPTDVWVRRVMSELYFNSQNVAIKEIQAFAAEKFKDRGGYAQQYLFNYARTFKVGANKERV